MTVPDYDGVLGASGDAAYPGVLCSPGPASGGATDPVLRALERRTGPPEAGELFAYRVLTRAPEPPARPAAEPPSRTPAPRRRATGRPVSPVPDPQLLDAVDAVRQTPQLGLLARLAAPNPALSPASNAALETIRGRIEALQPLKVSLVGSGWLLGLVSEVTNVPTPSEDVAKELGPGAARQMDVVVRSRITQDIERQLLRRDLTAEERNLWENLEGIARARP